jgi:hypothetical protein
MSGVPPLDRIEAFCLVEGMPQAYITEPDCVDIGHLDHRDAFSRGVRHKTLDIHVKDGAAWKPER